MHVEDYRQEVGKAGSPRKKIRGLGCFRAVRASLLRQFANSGKRTAYRVHLFTLTPNSCGGSVPTQRKITVIGAIRHSRSRASATSSIASAIVHPSSIGSPAKLWSCF